MPKKASRSGHKKAVSAPKAIVNRRARFDYDVQDSFKAGLVLSGPETKSLRTGHGHLRGAYVTIREGEAWLINATITPTKSNAAHFPEEQHTRARKLLIKRRELDELAAAKQQGLTIVPLKFLTGGRFIKLEISAARGKKEYDKRQVIKSRDQQRDIRRGLE